MAKGQFHVNDDNQFLICRADVQECRFQHFDDIQEAKKFALNREAQEQCEVGNEFGSVKKTAASVMPNSGLSAAGVMAAMYKNRKSEIIVKNKPGLEDKLSFSTGEIYYDNDLVQHSKWETQKEIIIENIANEDHQQAVKDYISDEYYEKINEQLRKYGTIEHLSEMSEDEFCEEMNFLPGDDGFCENCNEEILMGSFCEECETQNSYYFPVDDYGNEITADNMIEVVKNLDSYLEISQDSKEKVIFRGIKNGVDSGSINEGDVLDFKSYSSATSSSSVAAGFSGGVVFEMKTNKGSWISGEEQEFILSRNTRWTVAGKRETVHVVKGEGLESDYKCNLTIIQLIDEDLMH